MNDNMKKYLEVFETMFQVDEAKAKTLNYQDVVAWDSIGHMDLIATLEDTFDIEMETNDIINFNSFAKGVEILKKYGIDLGE